MNKVILFQPEGGIVSIMTPCECGLTIAEIGQKDVPAGLPFWIVDASDLPADRSMRNAWTLDAEAMGDPDGVGGTYIQVENEA